MFPKRIFFWAVLFLSSGSSLILAQPANVLRLSLEDCLNLADQNNAKLRAKEYEIAGAQWQKIESRIRFKPVVEINNRMAPVPTNADDPLGSFAAGDLTFFNGTKVSIGTPLYAFGKITKAQGLALRGVEAAKEKKEKERGDVHYDVKRLYYGILLGKESETLLQDAWQKIEEYLQKEGVEPKHSPYEIAKLKVFKLELEKKVAEVTEKRLLADEALRLQLGLSPEQSFELAAHDLESEFYSLKAIDYYLDSALGQRPEAHLLDIGVRAKQLEWELEKRKLLPSLGVGIFAEVGRTTGAIRNLRATDDFSNPFNFNRGGIGLELKWQFDLHSERAKINRLKNEYYKATTERDLAKMGLLLEVKEAYAETRQFKENLRIAEEKKKLARQMVFLSKSSLDIGVGEEQDYTDALQLLLSSRGEYLKAVFDYNIALAKLEWKVGEKR